jgi:hypothetical protein
MCIIDYGKDLSNEVMWVLLNLDGRVLGHANLYAPDEAEDVILLLYLDGQVLGHANLYAPNEAKYVNL